MTTPGSLDRTAPDPTRWAGGQDSDDCPNRRWQPVARPPVATDSAALACKIVIVGALLGLLWLVLGDEHRHALAEVRAVLQKDAYGVLILATGNFFLVVSSSAFLWRFYLVLRYRPVPTCGDEELLSCTVVVPAYNEGRQVADTFYSLLNSDYPADKLQIISVDDGSRDDTWMWIHLVASQHPSRLQAVANRPIEGSATPCSRAIDGPMATFWSRSTATASSPLEPCGGWCHRSAETPSAALSPATCGS